MKTCSSCKLELAFENFYKRKEGYQPYCKACANAKRAQWARDNTNKTREYAIKYKYGVSEKWFAEVLLAQENRCAICLDEFTSLPFIDHDHETGKARGLLCRRCNIFVGYVEKKNVVDNVLSYLAR